jgi:monooxygenase
MMDTIRTDFCIVGSGPAGLTLALLLVRSGADVVVVEKARSFDREYRGEILQPGAMALLDQLGVFAGVRERGGYELSRFQLVDHDRVLMNIDYRALLKPYDYLFAVPQRHILEELFAACQAHDGFHYLPGRSVRALLFDGDRVAGVECGSGPQAREVRAHVVVGADGRYSRVRRLAGIEYDRIEAFEHDVLWFKLPGGGRSQHDVRVFRDAGSPVLIHDSWPDRLQVGWTLPHKGYRVLADQGIEVVKEQIARALPPYADLVRRHITSLTDLSLLDVFAGTARHWARDGLVLIGDSAHTHGPIGAQGVNLAIQDAALAHPVLVGALACGDASARRLAAFETGRRPSIEKVLTLQSRQGKAMLPTGRVANVVRPVVARLLSHTPVYKKVLHQIAYGDRPVEVATNLLLDDPDAAA